MQSDTLPEEVIRRILQLYVGLHRNDEQARILPVLLTSRTFKNIAIPFLYAKVTVSSLSQLKLLANAELGTLSRTKVLVFLPCRQHTARHDRYCQKKVLHTWPSVVEVSGEIGGIPIFLRKWETLYTRLRKENKSWRLDRLEVYSAFGEAQQAFVTMFRPRKLVYHPLNLSCPFFSGEDVDYHDFIERVPKLKTRTIEVDISWLVKGDPGAVAARRMASSSPAIIYLEVDFLKHHVRRFFSGVEFGSWAGYDHTKPPKIKVTARERPYMLWDAFGEYREANLPAFEFVPEESCFGPQALLDKMCGFLADLVVPVC